MGAHEGVVKVIQGTRGRHLVSFLAYLILYLVSSLLMVLLSTLLCQQTYCSKSTVYK